MKKVRLGPLQTREREDTRLITTLQAYELSILTGTQVLLLVVSETGLVYTFTTTKLQPMVQKAEGKNLIQVSLYLCLSIVISHVTERPDSCPGGGGAAADVCW